MHLHAHIYSILYIPLASPCEVSSENSRDLCPILPNPSVTLNTHHYETNALKYSIAVLLKLKSDSGCKHPVLTHIQKCTYVHMDGEKVYRESKCMLYAGYHNLQTSVHITQLMASHYQCHGNSLQDIILFLQA